MKIAVCYFPHREGHNSIFPLLAFQPNFLEHGYELLFSSNIEKLAQSKPDIFVLSGFSVTKLIKANKLKSANHLIQKIFNLKIPFVYLSGNDATGPIDPRLLKYLDLFLARQLLKERELYLQPMRRHFFRDRYMKDFFFKNENEFPWTQLKEEELNKLGVSWNLALIDWKTQTNNKVLRYFYIWSKNKTNKIFQKGKAISKRGIGVTFRGNLFKGSHDVSRLHRLQSYRVYLELGKNLPIASPGIISYSQYVNEMRNTSVCISPFGWGEVCYRDFEAFQFGTLLMKPCMDHIDTYPNLYTAKNLISYQWDASDLKYKVQQVMDELNQSEIIADSGHEDFLKFTSGPQAGNYFLQHFMGIISKAKQNFELRKGGIDE